jgi:hypothetical protein
MKIKCDYKNLETLKVKQDMFNDDFVYQTVKQTRDKILKLNNSELKEWIKSMIWCSMDYSNVDVKEIRRHLEEDWA